MTAVTATPQPDTASVLLEVTGAPSPGAAVYVEDFEAAGDGWTVTHDPRTFATLIRDGVAIEGAVSLLFDVVEGAEAGWAAAQRAVTGFTVGAYYRLSIKVRGGLRVQAGVVGIGLGEPSIGSGDVETVTFEFVATGPEHTLELRNAAFSSAYAQVRFDQVEVAGVPPTPLVITRTDVNGTNRVRLYADQEPIAGALTVVDAEAALRGGLTYTVVDASGQVTASTSLDGLVAGPWLGVPVRADLGRRLDAVVDLRADRQQRGSVHDVIDRDDPVVTRRRLGRRRGTLLLTAADHGAAQAIADLYAFGETVQLRQPDHDRLDLYHEAQRVTVTREAAGWRVEVDYVEVAAPTAPLQGSAGWTFDDVTAFGTFADVRAAFATFSDLTAGTPTT